MGMFTQGCRRHWQWLITSRALHCWMMISAIRTLIAIRRVVRNKAVDSELHDGEHLTA